MVDEISEETVPDDGELINDDTGLDSQDEEGIDLCVDSGDDRIDSGDEDHLVLEDGEEDSADESEDISEISLDDETIDKLVEAFHDYEDEESLEELEDSEEEAEEVEESLSDSLNTDESGSLETVCTSLPDDLYNRLEEIQGQNLFFHSIYLGLLILFIFVFGLKR